MIVTRNGTAAFTAQFESEQELREEHQRNLAHGGLRLPTSETVPPQTTLLLTLRGPGGGEAYAKATVVAVLPDGIALSVNGKPEEILERLLEGCDAPSVDKTQSTWDRMRSLSQMEKLLLAVKADRTERALLLQDNDPRVLLSLLRNPRVTVDEVARLAKSSYLNYQIAEVIMKTAQWMASVDVRTALIRNPKTPPDFALRILPSLPESELRAIARGGTSMALKQAALKRLAGKA
jgi:hypothetical protein